MEQMPLHPTFVDAEGREVIAPEVATFDQIRAECTHFLDVVGPAEASGESWTPLGVFGGWALRWLYRAVQCRQMAGELAGFDSAGLRAADLPPLWDMRWYVVGAQVRLLLGRLTPLIIGQTYLTREARLVLLVKRGEPPNGILECVKGSDGIHRYDRDSDRGRVTGSAFDGSDSQNLIPLAVDRFEIAAEKLCQAVIGETDGEFSALDTALLGNALCAALEAPRPDLAQRILGHAEKLGILAGVSAAGQTARLPAEVRRLAALDDAAAILREAAAGGQLDDDDMRVCGCGSIVHPSLCHERRPPTAVQQALDALCGRDEHLSPLPLATAIAQYVRSGGEIPESFYAEVPAQEEEPTFLQQAMQRANVPVNLKPPWVLLSSIVEDGGRIMEIMAAAQFDGIGVLARWQRSPVALGGGLERCSHNGWICQVISTEEAKELDSFEEGESVPPAPPVLP